MARAPKKKLSKHLLEMKFMQGRSGTLGALSEVNAESIHIDDDHWVLDLPELKQSKNLTIQEPSNTVCEDLRFGRMSFKGFNPEIEKIMLAKQTETDLELAEEREQEISVNDAEMAERYTSLVGSIGNKFKSKKKRKLETNESVEHDDKQVDIDLTQPSHKTNSKKHKYKKHAKSDGRTFMKPKDD